MLRGRVMKETWRNTDDGIVIGSNETVVEYVNLFDYARNIYEILEIKTEDDENLRRII